MMSPGRVRYHLCFENTVNTNVISLTTEGLLSNSLYCDVIKVVRALCGI